MERHLSKQQKAAPLVPESGLDSGLTNDTSDEIMRKITASYIQNSMDIEYYTFLV